MKKWVALYGPAGCGKDSIAEYLCGLHGFERVAFADPVREMALAIDPWIDCFDFLERPAGHDPMRVVYNSRLSALVNKFGWDYVKREYDEARRLLQRIGTDAVRAQTPNYWVDWARAKAIDLGCPVVVTDTRFPNEADMVRSEGGMVVRIAAAATLRAEAASHPSETSMSGYHPDATLFNPYTDDDQVLDERMKRFSKIIADALEMKSSGGSTYTARTSES